MSLPGHIKVGAQADDEWQGRALVLRSHRQKLLASNIANADTPRYQAQDFDFSEAMRSAQRTQETAKLATTSGAHAEANMFASRLNTLDFVRYAQPAQASLDNNTVDMDRERASIAKNAILYELALAGVGDESSEMKLATSDPLKG
jgi:flagellar basal-body rod protein FlgB